MLVRIVRETRRDREPEMIVGDRIYHPVCLVLAFPTRISKLDISINTDRIDMIVSALDVESFGLSGVLKGL